MGNGKVDLYWTIIYELLKMREKTATEICKNLKRFCDKKESLKLEMAPSYIKYFGLLMKYVENIQSLSSAQWKILNEHLHIPVPYNNKEENVSHNPKSGGRER